MAGLIVFDPDSEEVGLSTGDDVAVNTFLDIQKDALYFTDGLNIYKWEGDETAGGPLRQTYIWRSGEVRMPAPANMGAALVEAEAYTETVGGTAGDPFWTSVIHLGKWEGADAATAYTELAQSDTHTFGGNAQLDTAQFNFGTSALAFDGTGDGVQSVGKDIYDLATTDDATVEGFVYFTALPASGQRVQLYGRAQQDVVVFQAEVFNNTGTMELRGRFGSGNFPAATITPSTGQWYHFAVQRRYNGGSPIVDLFWDGVRVGSVSSANNPDQADNTVPITFGAWDNATTQVFTEVLNGWLDDTRVTKAARYGDVATYTVPTTEYLTQAEVAGTTYNIIFRLYAEGVLKHTQIVTDDEPFRLPGGYLSNIYSVEIESAMPVTRVSVAENIFELSEG